PPNASASPPWNKTPKPEQETIGTTTTPGTMRRDWEGSLAQINSEEPLRMRSHGIATLTHETIRLNLLTETVASSAIPVSSTNSAASSAHSIVQAWRPADSIRLTQRLLRRPYSLAADPRLRSWHEW